MRQNMIIVLCSILAGLKRIHPNYVYYYDYRE